MKNVLMGRRDGEVAALYILRKSVHQPKDPTLLPSKSKCAAIVGMAMTSEVNRRLANAR